MSPVLEWCNHISEVWWVGIVHSSWQTAIVGVAVLIAVQGVGRRWPAPLRYALLVLALLKFACPPLMPVPTGLFSHLAAPKIVLPGPPERKPPPAPEFRVALSEFGAGGPLSASGRVAWFAFGAFRYVSWTAWLMALHAVGTAIMAVCLIRQARRLRRMVRVGRSRLQPEMGEHYRNLAIELGVYRIPAVAVSEEVQAPMAFGFRAAAIMLPARMLGRLSAAEMRAVLAHELAHCQRGDLWLNWIQLLLVAVWWFHPVAWLVHRRLQDVREDCCDDLLLARGFVSNDAYCDLLLRAAGELCPAASLGTALALTRPIHPLARRLARITDWDLQRHERISLIGAILVVLAAAVLFPGVHRRDNPAQAEARIDLPTVGSIPPAPAPRGPVQSDRPALVSAAQPAPPSSRTVAHTSLPRPSLHGRENTRPIPAKAGLGVVAARTSQTRPMSAVASAGRVGAPQVTRLALGPQRSWVEYPQLRRAASLGAASTPPRFGQSPVRLGPYLVPPVPAQASAAAWGFNASEGWGVVDRRL